MKLKLEIERDELLKLKSTNYEAYQLLNSLKLAEDLGYDYCETLDKEKLAKECELGYFKIEDLFTKKQIVEAYNNIEKISVSFVDRFIEAYSKPATDFVRGGSFHQGLGASDTPIAIKQKKHARLFEQIDENDYCVFIETKGIDDHRLLQEKLFDLGFKWRSGDGIELIYYKYIVINLFKNEKRVLCHTDSFDGISRMPKKYDFETERFI